MMRVHRKGLSMCYCILFFGTHYSVCKCREYTMGHYVITSPMELYEVQGSIENQSRHVHRELPKEYSFIYTMCARA